MGYIVESEIAVLFLSAILCVYLRTVYSGTDSAKNEFLKYCYVATFSSMVDVLCSVVLAGDSSWPAEAKYACAILWQVAANSVYFLWMRYILSRGPDTPLKAKMRYAQNIVLGSFFYFQMVGFFTGANYSIVPGSPQLARGDLWALLTYEYVTLWSVWTWGEMFLNRRAFTRGQWWGLWANYFICWQIQIANAKYFPSITINYIVISVNLYVFFFLLETPAYRDLDKTLDRLRKAKAKVDEANRIAMEADAAKGEFLANMSHEIRTPLTTILGMNEIILRKHDKGPIFQYANDIQSAGDTLLHIINDILDFSKIESGELELAMKDYHLGQVLRDVDNMIRIRAEQKGLKYITQIDSSLPDELFGDSLRIHQIMVNVLNNAVKYTRHGQVKFALAGERGSDASSITLHITVTDTGIGIHEEDIPRLFRSFSRVDLKETHGIEGTGLGLAITGRLIDLMGGSVDVQSTYGTGSTFHIVIPQKIVGTQTLNDFKADGDPEKKQGRRLFRAPDARVLIVDDNDMNRIVLESLLKETQVQVDQAGSGEECLKKVAANQYDVILMDYMMPKMDGRETLEHMKEMKRNASPDAKVIVCTANAIVGMRAELLAAGFDDFLSKPVNGKELEEMLVNYIPREKQQERFDGAPEADS